MDNKRYIMFLPYNNNMSNQMHFRLEEAIVIAIIISLGYLGGVISTQQLSSLNEKTVYEPNYNLSCPEPVRNVQMISEKSKNEPNTDNYIQAAYTEPDYTYSDGEVSVEISDISRPEGKSMRPTVFSGNTLLLEKYENGRITEGEILKYTTGSGSVIHRVQANYLDTEQYLLMRGDNNDHSSKVKKSQITHRVVGVLYTPNDANTASFRN